MKQVLEDGSGLDIILSKRSCNDHLLFISCANKLRKDVWFSNLVGGQRLEHLAVLISSKIVNDIRNIS